MKAVQISWLDSSFDDGWFKVDTDKVGLSHCETIGFVIKETKEYITVCQTHSDRENYAEAISIPKVCIKKMKELK